MNRRAFTLIELMIVLSVMSIALVYMVSPIQQLFGWLHRTEGTFSSEQAATLGFQMVREALRQTTAIRCLSAEEIACEGGPVTRIRRSQGGSVLEFEKDGRNLRVELLSGARFGPFQGVDARTFWGPVFMGDSRFPMFWRCGQ